MRRWTRSVNFKCEFEQRPRAGIQILGSAEKLNAESRHDWTCVYSVKSSLVFLVCVLAKVAGWNPSSWNIPHSSFNPSVHRLNTRTVSCIRWCCNFQSVTLSQARSLIFFELLSMAVVPRFADGATGGATAVRLAKASRSTHHKGQSSP